MRSNWFISQATGGRSEQQDSAVVITDGGGTGSLLAVLADGAGGHRGGQAASKTVISEARKIYRQNGGCLPAPQEQLRQLCQQAHDAINRLAPTPRTAPRSTIVALYVNNTEATWIHVGDSRIYRATDNHLVERSKDHTMAQLLLDQGEITDEEVGSHPDRIKLLRALGGEEMCKPSIGTTPVRAGDTFLLCSDGCWEAYHHANIDSFFRQALSQRRVDQLVQEAVLLNGPNSDNVTACAVEVL